MGWRTSNLITGPGEWCAHYSVPEGLGHDSVAEKAAEREYEMTTSACTVCYYGVATISRLLKFQGLFCRIQHTATHATHCNTRNTLQHTQHTTTQATHCNTLQHTLLPALFYTQSVSFIGLFCKRDPQSLLEGSFAKETHSLF